MNGFSVDLHDLQRAAEAMLGLGSELKDSTALKYSIMLRSVGHPELGEALSDLDKASQYAVSALLGKTTTAASRVKLTLDEYRRVDEIIADALARSVIQNPRVDLVISILTCGDVPGRRGFE